MLTGQWAGGVRVLIMPPLTGLRVILSFLPTPIGEPDTHRQWLRRHPSCIATAVHRIVPLERGAPSSEKSSHQMRLPQLQESDQLLRRGLPRSGYIGIDSPEACERITRFAPDYAARRATGRRPAHKGGRRPASSSRLSRQAVSYPRTMKCARS